MIEFQNLYLIKLFFIFQKTILNIAIEKGNLEIIDLLLNNKELKVSREEEIFIECS